VEERKKSGRFADVLYAFDCSNHHHVTIALDPADPNAGGTGVQSPCEKLSETLAPRAATLEHHHYM
jgi:hypothetical protein